MVDVKTELNPFRLKFGSDKNVELMVEVINDSDKARTISCEIRVSDRLAFDKQGRQRSISRQLGEMPPGERVREYLKVFPRIGIGKGSEPIVVKVMEHYENKYDYLLSTKTKKIFLRIE